MERKVKNPTRQVERVQLARSYGMEVGLRREGDKELNELLIREIQGVIEKWTSACPGNV